MSKRRYFGTDGIRGHVGHTPMTAEFVLKLGWAAGKVCLETARSKQRPRVLIGKDTRISGYMFESVLEAGFSAAGVDVQLLGPMPTPGIAYLTRTLRANGGVVISASHNPYYDNGIKFLSAQGTKLSDEIEDRIETLVDTAMTTVDSAELGKASRIHDAAGRYIEFCKSTFPHEYSLKGLKIVVDCAHGATYDIAPKVFAELGARVVTIGDQPDGLNINEGVGATDTQALQQRVVAEQADLGIALDGDGDRLMMVDHTGAQLDGDEVLYIIMRYKLMNETLEAGVVGTLMSNMGLEVACHDLGVTFKRAKVGDRYVLQMLQQEQWSLGGETSGHILCMDKTSSGDGIIAATQVLAAMIKSEKSLHDLKQGMTKFPQVMINVSVVNKQQVMQSDVVQQAVKQAEKELKEGRVLLRPSGTEPVVRVMMEGRHEDQVRRLTQQLADIVSEVEHGKRSVA